MPETYITNQQQFLIDAVAVITKYATKTDVQITVNLSDDGQWLYADTEIVDPGDPGTILFGATGHVDGLAQALVELADQIIYQAQCQSYADYIAMMDKGHHEGIEE